jgi:hypothetical protein
MNNLTEQQLAELSKIEMRIALIEDKCQDQVYIVLRRLVETYPNNYELGTAIRKLVSSI